MAADIRDLCRLCAKRDDFMKDLVDETNKSVLKLIQDLINITINDNENLPTKVCLNCEEKMVSFQLFVLECQRIQITLQRINKDDNVAENHKNNYGIKVEEALIKEEVKHELTPEDVVGAMTSESSWPKYGIFYQSDSDDVADDADEYDDLDCVTIASLKHMQRELSVEKKPVAPEDKVKLEDILRKPNFNLRELVKFVCKFCDNEAKTWKSLFQHSTKCHKSKPVVYCLCGFAIRTQNSLYKHVADHKDSCRKPITPEREANSSSPDAKHSKPHDFVRFICHKCKREFSSWYTLKSHTERYHKTSPIVRCDCGLTVKSKSVLYKHISDHKNPNLFSCDQCPRITKTLSALNKHKMRHIPKSDRKFCCTSCDKIFNTKDALKSHEKSHIPIEDRKIYNCEICNLKFTARSSAASHKRVVHDKIKSYVCDLCGYACGTNGELRQHRAIHSDAKPHICTKCNKSFKTYSNLKTHMDTHEDTSYVCFICSRMLNSRRTLRKHLLVHEEKCRHVCSYCNKAFKRRQTLKVHMYTHTGDKPLNCKWCDERFSYASTLRSHRLRCHPDKMASTHAQMHNTAAAAAADKLITHVSNEYDVYHEVNHSTQDYMKTNATAVNTSKNEIEN